MSGAHSFVATSVLIDRERETEKETQRERETEIDRETAR
jgi:hypothetical protein